MRRGQHSDYQTRLEISVRAAGGASDAEIACAVGCSPWTVRKWRRRFKNQGAEGLVSHMGRPTSGALGTHPAEVRERIAQLRRAHPGWGAPSLLDELARTAPHLQAQLPSRARVAAFLTAKGLTRRYERHAGVPQPACTRPVRAHEEWELDAQGVQTVAGLGPVSIINISDVVSRVKVASYPQPGQHLAARTYQLALRWGFVQYGLPERISLDHDSAWYDNTSPSPFPSRLHLWLVGLAVAVCFIDQPPPAAHAIIERTHQTLSRQTVWGQTWTSQAGLWYGLDQRCEALNGRLPCRSLGQQPPLVAYPEAARSPRPYRVEWEAELFDRQRVSALLATGRWFRQANQHGEFWLGLQRYNRGRAHAKETVEITFDPEACEFVTCAVGAHETRRFPARGLTNADLMGDLATVSLPNYQFCLPFDIQAWREMEAAAQLAGTTL